ncbi:MAG: hypothetical protein RH949_02115 [Coleofasciculus sp. A1-SPW-01]|uniref:hypothetical protein n=1 Tax=Coleofasciculus sp. A1-SPW-01 TaxID=3070819 RepID=UPI0033047C8B
MARKKNRKKTNIESLTSNVPETSETSESTKTVEESTQDNTEVNPPQTEESTQSSTPANPPATAEKKPEASTQSSTLANPPTAEKKPEASTQSSTPANPPTAEKKPYLAIKPKPIPAKSVEKKPPPPPVTEATNEAGELFHKGDSITVKAPWGGEATAEIVDFYQTHSGKIWAQYNPLDSQPNWTWYSGCIRTNLLEKATQTAQV